MEAPHQFTSFYHKHTLGSLKAQKTAIHRGHPATAAEERNRRPLVERETTAEQQSIVICIIDMDTVYNGLHHADRGRWREGKMTTREQSHNENKPKKSEALGQQM